MSEASFKFFDLFTLTVAAPSPRYTTFFESEYRLIPSGSESNVEGASTFHVDLHFVEELKAHAPATATSHVRRYKGLFTLQYAFHGLESDHLRVWIRTHPVDHLYAKVTTVFAQAQILEPLLYYKLLENRYLFMHASGVARDGSGVVFPARGGTGKTTLSLNLCRRGYQFLGDDLLFVDPQSATVYPYPKPLHLFSYNIDKIRAPKIGAPLRLKIAVKNVLRTGLQTFLRERFLISTRVAVDSIYPNITLAPPVPLRSVVYLTLNGEDRRLNLDDPEQMELASRSIISAGDLRKTLIEHYLEPESVERMRSLETVLVQNLLRSLGKIYFLDAGSPVEGQIARVRDLLDG